MIGRLSGVIVDRQPPRLLLEVGGVGYEIEAPMSTFYRLPANGEPTVLHTHLHVREDAHVLYGFSQLAERQLFRELIKVNGIGAKMALAVLSGIGPEEFAGVIETGDRDRLTRVPGIGKKTAERMLVEMRDRQSLYDGWDTGAASRAASPTDEASGALVALGYSAAEAKRLVKAVESEAADASAEDLIRLALKQSIR